MLHTIVTRTTSHLHGLFACSVLHVLRIAHNLVAAACYGTGHDYTLAGTCDFIYSSESSGNLGVTKG